MRTKISLLAALACSAATSPLAAVPVVSGRPVPALTDFDDIMTNYMDANSITAGVLGVMKDGRIIYLRGFGEDYNGDPLPENALMRAASVNKPVTAAVIRKLIADGEFGLGDNAFDLGQPGGGVLDCQGTITPWPALWDPVPADAILSPITTITIDHLLRHRAGWDRGIAGDHIFREVQIAGEMGVSSPPGRPDTLRWILGRPLEFAPGSQSVYSNIGYLSLGLIAEQVSGQDLMSYVHTHIFTKDIWVPPTEMILGRTFRSWQNPREPRYDDTGVVDNVFDSTGSDEVERPYGGWDQEALVGIGNMVVSAPAVLEFADRYQVGQGTNTSNTGQPLEVAPLTSDRSHGGALSGLSSRLHQRTDGYRIYVVFNRWTGTDHAGVVRNLIDQYLDDNYVPPIPRTSDGFWTEPSGGSGTNVGGYHQPFHSFGEMLAATESGSKIRLRPGTSAWTGKIAKRRRFDAPLGPAKIGL